LKQVPAVLAALLVVAVLVPPIAGSAHRYDWAESLQFVVLALVAPGLLVAGAPWRRLGLVRPATALAEARRRHPERVRSAAVAAAALACMVAWRVPASVDALRSGGWPLAIEVVSLSLSGTALWLECVTSPPLGPRSPRPVRIALCAAAMWTIWVLAYVVAMSNGDWYPAYHHWAGHGLSLVADQQITAGVMWATASACFVPVIFFNLFQWLQREEDPDEALQRMVREDQRRRSPRRSARP
jgi:cytochrome c oxidase assembly factor CtaG